jgi:hypothetical protein
MYVPNYYLAQRLAEQRMRDCQRKAEMRRMLQQAGVDQQGWLAFHVCKLLSGLGWLLVALGRRLERVARSPVVPSAALPRVSSVLPVR